MHITKRDYLPQMFGDKTENRHGDRISVLRFVSDYRTTYWSLSSTEYGEGGGWYEAWIPYHRPTKLALFTARLVGGDWWSTWPEQLFLVPSRMSDREATGSDLVIPGLISLVRALLARCGTGLPPSYILHGGATTARETIKFETTETP
ncbi:hypothetical protein RRG08_037960 [Elysia crispata]|uniref:Uncharacterized protein n=1 Tax=Elysia crispata TaxID=231223 RepID=A0AAE1DXC3_9GAST|nr:hypothetical protein RRG08_037960 [Elysia crispata]